MIESSLCLAAPSMETGGPSDCGLYDRGKNLEDCSDGTGTGIPRTVCGYLPFRESQSFNLSYQYKCRWCGATAAASPTVVATPPPPFSPKSVVIPNSEVAGRHALVLFDVSPSFRPHRYVLPSFLSLGLHQYPRARHLINFRFKPS